jgi:hypothetical protein
MLFQIYSDTKIYLVCPSDVKTGGPHSIYQLCHELTMLGHDASLVLLFREEARKALRERRSWAEYIVTIDVPPLFPKYNVKQSYSIQDSAANIIIVPERWPDLLEVFVNLQKGVWWLSTNSSHSSNVLESREIRHLCQSTTAVKMLIDNGYEYVYPLNDYTVIDLKVHRKIRQVAYNPKKGLELTRQIMAYAPDITFIPLISMSEEQIANALGESMVYIDFGGHPGKDRIPREAAISKCCVIVANTGTARTFQDVPIGREFKIDIEPFDPAKSAILIRNVLDRYDELLPELEMYRRVISMERSNFSREVQAIFGLAL